MHPAKDQGSFILLVLSLSLFCALLGVGIITPLLPIYTSKLGIGGPVLGLILGIFSFSRTGAMLISGEMAERFQKKTLLVAGLSVYALSSMGYMMAKSSATLMLVRFFHGLGSALVVPIAMAIGAEVAPRGQEGAFLGTLQTSLFLGIGSGPLLSGILTDHLGWNSSFFAMAAMTTLALLMVIIKLPSGSSPTSATTHHQKQGNPFPILFHMIRDRTLKPVLVFQFCSAMARGSLLMLVPLLAVDMNLSFFKIGIVVSVNSLATAICQRAFGKISDRKGKVPFIICGGLISAMVFFSLPFSQGFVSLTILSTLFGFGRSASSPALTAIAALRGKHFGVGRTMGIYNMAFSTGMMAGPVLGGIITESAGTDPAFLTMGIFLALSLLPFVLTLNYAEVEVHSTE